MKRFAAALLAVTALAPAEAGVIYQESGWIPPYWYDIFPQLPVIDAGKYEIRVTFDRAVGRTIQNSFVNTRYSYWDICDEGQGPICGGSDGTTVHRFTAVSDREFVVTWELLPSRVVDNRQYAPDWMEQTYIWGRPEDDSPSAFYSLTMSEIVPNAVPEPASWAMMIGGFALAGAAMRRRVQSPTYA
jgi:hypothetical protein